MIEPQNKSESPDGKRKEETSSPFDYLYDSLIDNDLNKMCSIMRNAETQQIIESLGIIPNN